MNENRDDSGQFASAPSEPATGRASLEEIQGFTPLPDVTKTEEPPITFDEAVEELASEPISTPESEVKTYGTFLDSLDPDISITLEQAVEITAEEKAAEAKAAEDAASEKLRAEVDERRGIEAEMLLPPETQALINSGLDLEVAKALQHPQVREAFEQEFSRADQVRESYTAGLEQARIASLASLAEIVPHLAGLDPARFEEGLAVLQQVDPPAFNQAMNVLQRTSQIVQAQQHAQQHQAQIRQAQMQEYGRAEDAKFKSMIGDERVKQLSTHLVPYLQKIGVDPQGLAHELQTNPRLRSAEAQKLVADAVAYDLIKSSAPKAAPRTLPPVQRPGTRSNVARSSESSVRLQTLEKQLASATGDKAARISAEIWGLQKKARA